MEELTKEFIERGNRLITNFIEPHNKALSAGVEFIYLYYNFMNHWRVIH